jgi:hypothetical protein
MFASPCYADSVQESMRLSEFLTDVGAPVAYYPKLAIALDSVKAAVFLCQLIYWRGKESHSNGWLYKTMEEIRSETGLSQHEQRVARKHLRRLGILHEDYERLNHRQFYRIDLDVLDKFWEDHRRMAPYLLRTSKSELREVKKA